MYTQHTPSLLVANFCSHLALLLVTASEPLDWWRESWSRSGPLVVGLLTTAAARRAAATRAKNRAQAN